MLYEHRGMIYIFLSTLSLYFVSDLETAMFFMVFFTVFFVGLIEIVGALHEQADAIRRD